MTQRELQIAQLIFSRIRYQDPKAEVILFGSHARGQAGEESDWDTKYIFTPLYQNIKREGVKLS